MFRTLFLLLLLSAASTGVALAHGINGHVWVSDEGIDHVHSCDLHAWLDSEEMRNILQIGAAFPDTGYATAEGRAYGETAHWEPFVQAAIEVIRSHYGPPYTSPESRQFIAYVMGIAAHGMQDEVFDTLFLRKTLEAEGTDQDLIDPGIEFIFLEDGHSELRPDIFLPETDLLRVYQHPDVNLDVDPTAMHTGMLLVRHGVIGLQNAREQLHTESWRERLPWSQHHYMDPQVPGSYGFEIPVMGPYYDALWHRLHDAFRLDDVVIATVPGESERLLSNDSTSVDSWVTLIFGYGVYRDSMTADNVRLVDADGAPVPIDIAGTRWGSSNSAGRLVQLQPQVDLEPDREYTAILGPGLRLIDGSIVEEEIRYRFLSACGVPHSCSAPPAPEPRAFCEPVAQEHIPAYTTLPPPEAGGCSSTRGHLPAAGLMLALALLWTRIRARAA